MDKEKLLKSIVSDLIQNSTKKEWKTYSLETFGSAEYGENCRSVWKAFRKTFQPQGLWTGGIPIEESWKENVTRALALEKGSAVLDDAPEGFAVTKMFQQQNKAGDVIWLKSVEKNRDADAAKDFYDKSVEAFQNIVTLYEPTKIYLLPQNKPTENCLNILLSDLHIGAAIPNSLTGDKYDKETYLQRLRLVIDTIEKVVTTHGVLDTLSIVVLGDTTDSAGVAGKTTRGASGGGHVLEQNMDCHDQFDTFVKSFIDLFHTIVSEGFAANINFVSATNDNHSGVLGYAASRAIEVYLNAKYPDISTIVSKDFIFDFKVGDKSFICLHGKDMHNMQRNIPFVLSKDHVDWIDSYIDLKGLDRGIPFNHERHHLYLLTGDLHQSKTEFHNRFTYKRVMSLFGATNYIDYNFSRFRGYKGFEHMLFPKTGIGCIEGREFIL